MSSTRKLALLCVGLTALTGCVSAGAPPAAPPRSPTSAATSSPLPALISVRLSEFFDEMSAQPRLICSVATNRQALPAGAVRMAVLNRTNVPVAVAVLRVDDGHSYADLRTHLATERKPPLWSERSLSVTLDAGEATAGEGVVRAGVHAIGCTASDEAPVLRDRVSLIGPLAVE